MESPLDPNFQQSNIPQGYKHNILDEIIKIINEELNALNNQPVIEITKQEPDYRSSRKQDIRYNVNYQKLVDGNLIEIVGTLSPYHTGRAVEYGFEPGYFDFPENEKYWDENWETIEKEIMDKFYDGSIRMIRESADDIYQKSLNDPYWKEISKKFPDYNSPDSDDHEKATQFIINQMKAKYPNENWKEIENDIRTKISDGTT